MHYIVIGNSYSNTNGTFLLIRMAFVLGLSKETESLYVYLSI
jgi:hypothetical protein